MAPTTLPLGRFMTARGSLSPEPSGGVNAVLDQRKRFGQVMAEVDFNGMAPVPSRAARAREKVLGEWAVKDSDLAPFTESTRVSAVEIGRSGFDDLSVQARFAQAVTGFQNRLAALMRRVGFPLDAFGGKITSATGGDIDVLVRRSSRYSGVPGLAYACPVLVDSGYVDPDDKYPLPTVWVDDNTLYSANTFRYARELFSYPGGAWALYNDVPAAALAAAMCYFVDMDIGIAPIKDGRVENGNALLIAEIRGLLEEYARLKTQYCSDHDIVGDLSEDQQKEIWQKTYDNLTTADANSTKHLTIIWNKIKTINADFTLYDFMKNAAIIRTAEEQVALHLERFRGMKNVDLTKLLENYQHSTEYFQAAGLRVALTGTIAEMDDNSRSKVDLIRQIVTSLRDNLVKNDFSMNELGVIFGWTTRELPLIAQQILAEGGAHSVRVFPKGTEGKITPDVALYSDIIAGIDHADYARVFLGDEQGFSVDVLVCIEGDSAEAKSLIKKAVQMGIPVVILQYSETPLHGKVFYLNSFQSRDLAITNVAKWVDENSRKESIPVFVSRINELCIAIGLANDGEEKLERNNVGLMSWSLDALEMEIGASKSFLSGQEKNIAELEFVIGELKDLLDLSTTTQKNPNGITVVKSSEDLVKILLGMKK